jgi:hypothetical protein
MTDQKTVQPAITLIVRVHRFYACIVAILSGIGLTSKNKHRISRREAAPSNIEIRELVCVQDKTEAMPRVRLDRVAEPAVGNELTSEETPKNT